MERVDRPVNIQGLDPILGGTPIVIIGPNGSGKTHLGVTIANQNNGQRISALRNLEVPSSLQMMSTVEAQRDVVQRINSTQSSPWATSNELAVLLSKLKAEDSESAIAFRDASFQNPGSTPPETKVTKLTKFWNEHFPERSIDLTSYAPKASSNIRGTPYPIAQMSDGERVALYLAARLLDAQAGVIVVDEPEVHLHPVLARKLWNALEQLRHDCRFVYITHDLPFALSRENASFIVVKPGVSPQLLPPYTNLPSEIVESILGAASFSVSARRIVFCEGRKGGERDEALYSAWFNGQDTAVVPVGSCDQVIKCVEVFRAGHVTLGVTAIGIIDRDYWPDAYFNGLPEGIHVLPYHEVESLLSLEDIFKAVCTHVGETNAEEKYGQAIATSKARLVDVQLNKQIIERAKKRIQADMLSQLNAAHPETSLESTKGNFLAAVTSAELYDPSIIFDNEVQTVNAALAGDALSLLKVFPGKSILSDLTSTIGMTTDRYCEIVTSVLSRGLIDPSLLSACQSILGVCLPSRNYEIPNETPR